MNYDFKFLAGLMIGLILQYIWPVHSPAALAVDAASLLLTFVVANYIIAWILKVILRHEGKLWG